MPENPIRPRGEMPEVPKATTITASTVKRAYIFQDWRAQRQIEAHGRMQKQTIRDLISREPAPEPEP